MLSSAPPAAAGQREALDLTAGDFRFVHYANPDRFFASEPRPFRLVLSPPALATYGNAVYTPSTRAWKPFDGALYDAAGNRIAASVIRRAREDTPFTSEPESYGGDTSGLPVYDRPLLYLGYFNWHYGHFLLESLSYWWAVAQFPGIDRYLIHLPDKSILDKPHVRACLEAVGIAPEALVHFDTPTRLREVIVPDPAFQLSSHVYTAYRDLMHRVAVALGGDDVTPSDQPIYISRRLLSQGNSRYNGEEQLESYLVSRGVQIVHPQKLPFAEQVKLFNRHRTILGIIGSGMHNIVLGLEPKTMVYFTPDGYKPNAFLVDKCFGANATYLNACRGSDWLETMRFKLTRTFTGKLGRRADGFRTNHNLDQKRIVGWLEGAGVL